MTTPVEKKLIHYLLVSEPRLDPRGRPMPLDLINDVRLLDDDAIKLSDELGGGGGYVEFAQARARMAEKMWCELPEGHTWDYPGV